MFSLKFIKNYCCQLNMNIIEPLSPEELIDYSYLVNGMKFQSNFVSTMLQIFKACIYQCQLIITVLAFLNSSKRVRAHCNWSNFDAR